MIESWPAEVSRVFDQGSFCHLAIRTRFGPHLTPTIFAPSGGRLWLTTARDSVKARAWRKDLTVAGMVRSGDAAVAFIGVVRLHDALDPVTWEASLRNAPALATAAVRFSKKNARFYAGYAVDARYVPLRWTPPGRVFVEVSLSRVALADEGGLVDTWGPWKMGSVSGERFRARRAKDALGALPAEVRAQLGASGVGALAVEGPGGISVLPTGWTVRSAGLFAGMPKSVLGLAGCDGAAPRVALTIENSSSWRASRMIGAMVQGRGELLAIDQLSSGRRSAAAIAVEAGAGTEGSALVRIVPTRSVWWRGWSSGTATP